MSDALLEMMPYVAEKDLMEKIKYGQKIASNDIHIDIKHANPFIKIIDNKNQLLAVVSPDEGNERYNYCCVFYNP